MGMGELYHLCTSIIFTVSMSERTPAKIKLLVHSCYFNQIDGSMFTRIQFVQGVRKSEEIKPWACALRG